MSAKRNRPYPSLKAWRQAHGLSQREAAKRLGVDQASYAQYELGNFNPRPPRAVTISEKTGVPFEVLMGVA